MKKKWIVKILLLFYIILCLITPIKSEAAENVVPDCEIDWGEISYIDNYSAVVIIEADDLSEVTEAYHIANGKQVSAKVVHDEDTWYTNKYNIEYIVNYSPNTKIEAYVIVDGYAFTHEYIMPNISPDIYIEDISSTSKTIKGNVDENCTISVQIDGKDYSTYCKAFEDFSISIPKINAGSQILVTATNDIGHYYKKTFTVKPGESFVGIMTPVHCADGYVEVYGDNYEKGDLVTVVANGKKYSKKVISSKADQYIKVKVGEMKNNSIITATIYDSRGNVKGADKEKVTVLKSSVKLKKKIFRTSDKASIKLSKLQKGDKIKLKIGTKTYTQTIKKDSKNKTLNFSITKTSAGKKVTITAYDKYGNKKGSKKDIVYYGTKVYVGMSTKNLKLTTWGKPDYINYYSNSPDQWVYKRGVTTLYVYVSGGKVISYQKLH